MKYKLQKKQDTYTKGSNWKHFRLWEAAVFATISSHTTHGYTWSSTIRKHTSLLYTSDFGWGGLTRQGRGGGVLNNQSCPLFLLDFDFRTGVVSTSENWLFSLQWSGSAASVKWFCGAKHAFSPSFWTFAFCNPTSLKWSGGALFIEFLSVLRRYIACDSAHFLFRSGGKGKTESSSGEKCKSEKGGALFGTEFHLEARPRPHTHSRTKRKGTISQMDSLPNPRFIYIYI